MTTVPAHATGARVTNSVLAAIPMCRSGAVPRTIIAPAAACALTKARANARRTYTITAKVAAVVVIARTEVGQSILALVAIVIPITETMAIMTTTSPVPRFVIVRQSAMKNIPVLSAMTVIPAQQATEAMTGNTSIRWIRHVQSADISTMNAVSAAKVTITVTLMPSDITIPMWRQ